MPVAEITKLIARIGGAIGGALEQAAPTTTAPPELVDALAALLQRLPDWRDARHRRLFIEQALLGHPRLAELRLGGTQSDDALALALDCLDPDSGDPVLACRLLQQLLRRPIGSATQSEAEGLLRRLGLTAVAGIGDAHCLISEQGSPDACPVSGAP